MRRKANSEAMAVNSEFEKHIASIKEQIDAQTSKNLTFAEHFSASHLGACIEGLG